MKIKSIFVLLLILTASSSLFAQKQISEFGKYSLKKLLFTNDYLNVTDDTSMVPFDIVELYTVANNSAFQFSAKSIDAPFVLTFYGFKYGNQNGIIINSAIGDKYYQDESVAHVYTIKQVLNSITYFNSLNVKKVKSPQLICLDKKRKTFIEFSDNRAFESVIQTKREYKIWYYVIGTEADNFIPFGNVTIQYRYHEFNESDLSKLKVIIEKYFIL